RRRRLFRKPIALCVKAWRKVRSTMANGPLILITCEHATNAIPKRYTSHFSKNWLQLLQTHRGYDIGALSVAKALARKFRTKVIAAKVSRLLIDCNRSLHHQRVFSEATS